MKYMCKTCQKPCNDIIQHLRKMTLRDKEKIEKALQEIHDFKILYVEQLALFSCENSPRYERLLKEIVKTLT